MKTSTIIFILFLLLFYIHPLHPDGKYLAYSYQGELYVLDIEQKEENQIRTEFYANSNLFTRNS